MADRSGAIRPGQTRATRLSRGGLWGAGPAGSERPRGSRPPSERTSPFSFRPRQPVQDVHPRAPGADGEEDGRDDRRAAPQARRRRRRQRRGRRRRERRRPRPGTCPAASRLAHHTPPSLRPLSSPPECAAVTGGRGRPTGKRRAGAHWARPAQGPVRMVCVAPSISNLSMKDILEFSHS